MNLPTKIFILLAFFSACAPLQSATRRIENGHPVVALTFDDGPDPVYTDQVLQILAEHNIPATFFLIGKQVEKYPEIARRILKNGHEIGGHSYDWSSWVFKPNRQIRLQLEQMKSAFSEAGISNISLFRAPNGILIPWQKPILKSNGLTHITADVIAGDWKNKNRDQIHDAVIEKVQPGSIIVLHDGGGNRSATVEALLQIIQDLQAKGYSFLTISKLLSLHKFNSDTAQDKPGK